MPKKWCVSHGRRRTVLTLAALAGSTVPGLRASGAAPLEAGTTATPGGHRTMSQLMGSNGWPFGPEDVRLWQEMGLTWGRDSVGPGPTASAHSVMRIDKTGPGYDTPLPPIILRNNRSGINSLLFLGYTPEWNALVPGDDKSAPRDVHYWEQYVEAVVRQYSAPPYNLKYFQIWNEAAGRLAGGDPQATFWHGPSSRADQDSSRYVRAMEDYVDRIHIPAARIIRKYGAYIVYGGWPDQGGLDNYCAWLEYKSPVQGSRMLDWVDYLDIHYLSVGDMETLYQRYLARGQARGIWQSEMGDRYINDPHFLPMFYFELATWALERSWDDPNKYVAMIYHWEGTEPYRLTRRGPPRSYTVSGKSLTVLHQTVSGELAPFPHEFSHDRGTSSVKALYSRRSIVVQVNTVPGSHTIDVTGLSAPASGRHSLTYIDAITGAKYAKPMYASTWQANKLSIRFEVPQITNGPKDETPRHLTYLVVTPLA